MDEPDSISSVTQGYSLQRLVTEQTRLLFMQSFVGIIVAALIAIIIAIVAWPVSRDPMLWYWASLIVLSNCAALVVLVVYRLRGLSAANTSRAARLFGCCLLFSGYGWGLAPFLMAVDESLLLQLAVYAVLVGIMASSTMSLTARMDMQFVYVFGAALPASAWLLLRGEAAYWLLGLMLGISLAAIVIHARAAHQVFARGILLGFENSNLVEVLSRAKDRVEVRNRQLRHEAHEHKQTSAALRHEQERLRVSFAAIGDGIIMTNLDGLIESVNPVAEQLLGMSADQLLGRQLHECLPLHDERDGQLLPNPVVAALQTAGSWRRSGMLTVASVDGQKRLALDIVATPIQTDGDGLIGVVVALHDSSELRQLIREMSHQSGHDSLTGLLNRREFDRRLEQAVEQSRREGREHVLCYMDLDRFKLVNDQAGHLAGDHLLASVAKLFDQQTRDTDTLARVGGDEFAALLYDCPLAEAERIADELRQVVEAYQFTWSGQNFRIGVSVGLAPITSATKDVREALNGADTACYLAKEQGRNRVQAYNSQNPALARHHGDMRWVPRLRKALDERNFKLYAQPISRLSEGGIFQVCGAEVLLRLVEGEEVIEPTQFLGAAERFDLITSLDRWVIESSLRAKADGLLEVPDSRFINVNVSCKSLEEKDLVDFIERRLEYYGLSHNAFCLELAESTAARSPHGLIEVVRRLAERGMRFTLDDFGHGVSSFALLRQLPLTSIKIHGDFVGKAPDDRRSLAMLKAINDMAHAMGIETVADMVESLALLEPLAKVGMDMAQGYALAPVVPVADLLTLVSPPAEKRA